MPPNGRYQPVSTPRKVKARSSSTKLAPNPFEIEPTPLEILEEIFPDRTTEDLKDALQSCHQDLERAIAIIYDQPSGLSRASKVTSDTDFRVAEPPEFVVSAVREVGCGTPIAARKKAKAPVSPARPVPVIHGTCDSLSEPPERSKQSSESAQFLCSMFPALTAAQVEDTLVQYNENVETALEFLLSSQSDSADETLSVGSSTDLSSTAELSPSQFDNSSSTSPSVTGGRGVSPSTENGSREHPGDIGNQELETLSDMFPDHNRRTIISTLKSHNFDVSRAADTLWRLKFDDVPSDKPGDEDHALAALIDIFPEADTDILTRTLRRVGELEVAIDELARAPPTSRKNDCDGSCVAAGFPCIAHGKFKSGSPFMESGFGRTKQKRASSAPARSEVSILSVAARGSSISSSFKHDQSGAEDTKASLRLSAYAHPNEVHGREPKEFRKLAQDYREKRDDAFRRAAVAFRKGDLTGRGSAGYYSEEGRALTDQMAKWNDMAAFTVIQQNKARLRDDPYSIDLHGLTVTEALKYVDEAVNEWYSRDGSRTKPHKPLKVIAGAGQHSSQGIRKLYPAVVKTLRSKGWNVAAGGNGWFYVKP